MRWRKVPPTIIVRSMIEAHKAGLKAGDVIAKIEGGYPFGAASPRRECVDVAATHPQVGESGRASNNTTLDGLNRKKRSNLTRAVLPNKIASGSAIGLVNGL